MMPMLLTFWFFLSPIFYLRRQLRGDLAWLLDWNPMTYLIELYRQVFIFYPGTMGTDEGSVPWSELGTFAAIACCSLFLGYYVFSRLQPKFADEV
jgi:lipopolysaccharide transport system permease protein